jgi:hypothetical protein
LFDLVNSLAESVESRRRATENVAL